MMSLACATTAVACGFSNTHPVEGTVDSVGNGHKNSSRYIKLVGDDTVYYCMLSTVRECGVIEEGKQVQMIVGYDEEYGIEDAVASLTYVTNPS